MTESNSNKNEVDSPLNQSPDGEDIPRPDPSTSLHQVKPGSPWGVPKPHMYTHVRHALGDSQAIQAAYIPLALKDALKRRVIGFLGNFGSGKTEVAINFALQLGLASSREDDPFTGPVRVIDLDIVNPYFRSREAAEPLQIAGVEVVAPIGDKFWADLPIILPEVKGHLKRHDGTVILDVGGDDLGARVLSHLKDDFPPDNYTLIMVINANRPFTSELEGAAKVLKELESAAGLKISGLVSNTHLMDETTPDEIRRGYEFAKDMSSRTGLELLMVTAESHLLSDQYQNRLKPDEFDCLLLPLNRFMLPPWMKAKLVSDTSE